MYSISVLIFLSHFVFIAGLLIFINNKDNIFIMFIITELVNLSGIFNFIVYSYYFNNLSGPSLSLIFFSLSAAEAAIGLTLIISFVKLQNNISLLN